MAFDRRRREEVEERRTMWRSPEGRREFVRLVVDCKVFDTIDDGDMQALHLRNYAIGLLYDLGILNDRNLGKIVDKLMDIDYTEEE